MMKSLALAAAAVTLLLNTPALAGEYVPGEFGSLAVLLGNESVRQELKLSKDQEARLDRERQSYRTSARQFVSKIQGQATEADARKLQRLTDKSNRKALATLNSSQKSRLIDIERNILGGRLLYSKSIQSKLGITPAQQKQVDEIEADGLQQIQDINREFEEGEITHHQKLRQLREGRVKRSKQLLSLLTPEQKDAFGQL